MDAPPDGPVTPDEFVLRRVHKNHFDPALPVPVQPVSTRPTASDDTGLSVYREAHYPGNPAGILAQVEDAKKSNYYVCRVRVADLDALGLTVRPEQGPDDLPGHCVIPELNRPAYDADKAALADQILALAELLGRDIVHSPQPSG